MPIDNTNTNSISSFKNVFQGGTRANRFNVSIPQGSSFPVALGSIDKLNTELQFKISATNLPDSNMGVITHYHRGRPINFAGDRQYPVWNVTVFDDSNVTNNLWKMFHTWIDKLDGHVTHQYDKTDFSYKDYICDFLLTQYGLNGKGIRQIRLHNVWPTSVGEIILDMGENNMVTFGVQLMFDYMEFINVDQQNPTINQSLR